MALLAFNPFMLQSQNDGGSYEKCCEDDSEKLTIKFNFADKTISGIPKKIGKHKKYQLKICNFNQFLYKVDINVADTQIEKAIEVPSISSLNVDAITGLLSAVSPMIGFANEPADESTPVKSDTGLKIPSFFDKSIFDKPIDDIKDYTEQISEINNNLNSYNDSVYIYVNQFYEEYLFNGGKETFNGFPELNFIKQKHEEFSVLNGKIIKSELVYLATIKNINDTILKIESIKQLNEVIKSSYTLLKSTTKSGMEATSAIKTDSLRKQFALLNNLLRDKGVYTSMPFQFKSDLTKLTIDIKPRNDDYYLQSYKAEYEFPTEKPVYAALGVSFYYAGLNQSASSIYSYKTDGDTLTYYKVSDEKADKGEIGSVALLHLGYKFKNGIGLDFSFGPGISFTKTVKPRLLTGLGFIYGRNHHNIVVNGGLVVGYVDELRDIYKSGKTIFTEKPTDIYYSKTKASYFFSIGYLFTL